MPRPQRPGGAGNRGRGYYTWIKVRICEDDFTVAMKADSASHLLRQPINFELFLFVYLVCALILQIINIYKNVRWCSLIRVFKLHFIVSITELSKSGFESCSFHSSNTEPPFSMVHSSRNSVTLETKTNCKKQFMAW